MNCIINLFLICLNVSHMKYKLAKIINVILTICIIALYNTSCELKKTYNLLDSNEKCSLRQKLAVGALWISRLHIYIYIYIYIYILCRLQWVSNYDHYLLIWCLAGPHCFFFFFCGK